MMQQSCQPFVVGGTYADRRGEYKVISLEGKRIELEYKDGSPAWSSQFERTEIDEKYAYRVAERMGQVGSQGAPFQVRSLIVFTFNFQLSTVNLPRSAGRTRPPYSIALQPLHGSTASSTPLFSSLCKIFRK